MRRERENVLKVGVVRKLRRVLAQQHAVRHEAQAYATQVAALGMGKCTLQMYTAP